jgi:hypothetical protein
VLGSDYIWNLLGEIGAWAVTLYPLRTLIQPLAQKYRHSWKLFAREATALVASRTQLESRIQGLALKYRGRPQAFEREVIRLVRRCARKMRLQDVDPVSNPMTLPHDLSQNQLRAIVDLVPVFRRMMAGRQVKQEPKKVLASFHRLGASRPGPVPSETTCKILSLYRNGRAKGSSPTYGWIARQVYPEYHEADGHMRRRLREKVRKVIRNHRSDFTR